MAAPAKKGTPTPLDEPVTAEILFVCLNDDEAFLVKEEDSAGVDD